MFTAAKNPPEKMWLAVIAGNFLKFISSRQKIG